MNRNAIIGLIVVVVLALIGVLTLRAGDRSVSNEPATPTPTSTGEQTDSRMRTISGLHQYQPDESQHIVAGTTTVPTPCHQLSTDTEIRGSDATANSNSETITVNFSADRQNPDQACAQKLQEVRFRLSFSASEDAQIVGGEYNGAEVQLNLREVGSDQNLEDFQVYTKG